MHRPQLAPPQWGSDCPVFGGSNREIKPSTASIFSSTDSDSCYKKSSYEQLSTGSLEKSHDGRTHVDPVQQPLSPERWHFDTSSTGDSQRNIWSSSSTLHGNSAVSKSTTKIPELFSVRKSISPWFPDYLTWNILMMSQHPWIPMQSWTWARIRGEAIGRHRRLLSSCGITNQHSTCNSARYLVRGCYCFLLQFTAIHPPYNRC